MGTPAIYDDSFVAGDTYKLQLIYKDSDGVPIDLTGYTVDMELRKSIKDKDFVIDKNYVISSEDGILGIINILLEVEDTEFLVDCGTKASYVYDIQLTNIAGDEVQTIVGGTFEVFKGVTRQ